MDSTNLPATWLTQFTQKYPRPYLTVIYDPTGMNLTFDNAHGIISIESLGSIADIDPAFNAELTLQDITIGFSDTDEYFSPFTERVNRAFKQITRILDEDTTNNPVTLRAGVGEFITGDTVIFDDGVNTESKVLTSAVGNDIGWSGGLSHTYAAGALVGTVPMTGFELEVYMKIDGLAGQLLIYRGIVMEPFKTEKGRATLRVQNYLRRLFDTEITLHATSYLPTDLIWPAHIISSSFTWSTGATTALAQITAYAGCLVGSWTIKMGTHGDTFLVTDPNGRQTIGDTDADFYDNTNAADSQIYISVLDWSTPTESDELNFKICANFYNMTIPEILAEILEDYGGIDADIGGTGINDASVKNTFNVAQSILTKKYSISIHEKQSILQSFLAEAVHELIYAVQMRDGTIGIICLHPDFKCNLFTPKLAEDPVLERFDIGNAIKVNFDFDYTLNACQYSEIYPGTGANISSSFYNKVVAIEVNCPAINN